MDYWLSMYRQAEAAVRGHLVKAGHSEAFTRAGYTNEDFFNGTSRKLVSRFMSEELREWLDKHAMTKGEWLALHYEAIAKRLKDRGGPARLSEW